MPRRDTFIPAVPGAFLNTTSLSPKIGSIVSLVGSTLEATILFFLSADDKYTSFIPKSAYFPE